MNINRRQVKFILNSKKVGRKRTIYAHACNKNTLVTVSGKKYVRLNDIQITIGIGFEFDYIPIRFYLFLVY